MGINQEQYHNRDAGAKIDLLLDTRDELPTHTTFGQDAPIRNMGKIPSAAASDRRKVARVTDCLVDTSVPCSIHDTTQLQPSFSSIPVIAFQYDPALGRDETIIATIKTTLQVHRNDRQQEQKTRPSANVFGRECPRRYVYGFVAAFSLRHDRLDWALRASEWAFSALEPYAVDACGDSIALAGGSYIRLINLHTAKETAVRHPWLSQVHSVQFSADGARLLVASSGFDAVIEFETESGEISWEWFAWEHGFDRSMLGHHVVRLPERRDALMAVGHDVILVDDPSSFEFGVATRLIPAHLNSALYDIDGRILVSLFHQGAAIVIDRTTGEAREVISGLVNPHKFSSRRRGGYFISDTRRGKLIFMGENYRRVRDITLAGLPGVERSRLLGEFLQNTTELKDALFACIDIHRNSLWLVDMKRHKYRCIKFPAEWSMHEVAALGQECHSRIGRLVGKTFGAVEAFADEQQKVIRHLSPDGREIVKFTHDTHGRARELDVTM